MPAGQMQIDGRLFQITVSEQQLDGAQVCACLQQVRRETMSKRVRVDLTMRKSGALGSVLTGIPKNLGGNGTTSRMPPVPGEQPLGRLAAKSAPVGTKRVEQ